MKNLLCLSLVILTALSSTDTTYAQLFGQRTLGRSLSRNSSQANRNPGTLDGDRRFLRDQRSASDFVGASAAGGGAAGFVGATSAVTNAVSSITGLREETRPPLNRPRTLRNGGLYAERLMLSTDSLSSSSGESVQTPPLILSSGLNAFLQARELQIEVSSEGRSVTLRGEVPSEHDRQMAAMIVSFEPGIQTVVNDLTVNPSLPPISTPERARRWTPDHSR